jgi:alkanesulfonate monooxygenase SsuD/methylene tetrahydromethanopterin reductase-like flavin-dependent oxidoreductase (luciferase family)
MTGPESPAGTGASWTGPPSHDAVGLVIGSSLPPERLAAAARVAEASGFGEIWVAEDFFFSGGIAGAALALGATDRLRVGLGVVSAVVRHPAQLAMELATLARAYPGRLVPGIGLGVPGWVEQMGLMPRSPLTAIRECVTVVRRLLDGEVVDHAGSLFQLSGARLVHPPAERLPIVLGVIGPRMLRLSGAIADGSVLSVVAGPAYVRTARELIEAGQREAGRDAPHLITAFALGAVDRDRPRARAAARRALAFYLAAGGVNAPTEAAGISGQLEELLPGGADAVEAGMPDAWVEELTVSGDPDDVVRGINALRAAGADRVALFPVPPDAVDRTLDLLAREVLPRV